MTSDKALIEKLKELRHTSEGGMADSRVKARIFEVLSLQIGSPSPSNPLSPLGLIQYFVSPRLAYGFAAFVLMIGAVWGAVQAQGALPGDPLYGAKLAAEATQARLVSNPAERAKVQMEFAGKRLRELEQVAALQPGASEETQQTDAVLKRFSQDIKQAQASLKQAGDPLQVKQAREELAKKAREYEKKLVEVKSKPGREVGVAALAEAEQALKQVQENGPAGQEVEIQSSPVQPSPALEVGEVGI